MPTLNLGKIRFNWRGSYSAATAYVVNDCVSYGVSAYVCIQKTTAGIAPTNGSYWQLMSQGIASPLTTRGDLWYRGASADARLPIGAAGTFMQSNGTDPVWQVAPFRPHDTAAQLAHMNDAGAGTYIMAFITADRKHIKLAGRDASLSALVGGNTAADIYQDTYTTVAMSPVLDDDDYLVDLAVGHATIAAVTNKGRLYTGGHNNYGQLGHGDTTNRVQMQRVASFFTGGANPRTITKVWIACDQYWQYISTYVLTSTGEVWATGYNGNGNLGNGNTTNQSSFVRAGTITGVTNLSLAGSAYTSVYAWNASGRLWVWGYNGLGQLGIGNTTNQSSPVLSALTNVKKVISVGSNYFNGTNHGSWGSYAVALKNDGTVWGTGQNGTGALGVGDTAGRSTWTQSTSAPATTTNIFAGGGGYYSATTFALTTGGQLYATGHNWCGNLGVGDDVQRNVFTLCKAPAGVQGTITDVKAASTSRYGVNVIKTSTGKLYLSGRSFGIWCGSDGQFNTFTQVVTPPGTVVSDYVLFDSKNGVYEDGFGLLALTTGGEVLGAGDNAWAILGRSTRREQNALAAVMV